MVVQGMAARLLSREPPPAAMARALCNPAERVRDQRNLLPNPLRGGGGTVGGRYHEGERGDWAELLRIEAAARDVYAFAKHKGVAPEDPAGGVGLALWLRDRHSQ